MPRLVVLFVLLLGVGLAARVGFAQQPDADSIRTAALRNYHGSDLEGKDGPLAKAGLDLLVLYHEYRAVQEEGGDGVFSPSVSRVPVADGRVTIDAIAATSTDTLRADLEALGLTNAATAGGLVSGRLPLDRVPDLAKLESLRGVAPSRMQTRTDVEKGDDLQSDEGQARPAPAQDTSGLDAGRVRVPSSNDTTEASPPDTSAPAPLSDSSEGNDEAGARESDDEGFGVGALVGLVAVVAGLVGLFFGLRR